MRIDRRPIWRGLMLCVIATVGATTAPGAASGATCSHPAQDYATGGPPAVTSPNDPLFARQWALRQIDVPGAWSAGARGAGAVVAVLDTGVDLAHPDLSRKLLPGVDFYEVATGVGDCAGPQDEAGHGTGVAGLIAARTDNSIGIAGIAPKAKVLPLRVWGPAGPNADAVAAAIRYAADNGAGVINMSFGTTRDGFNGGARGPIDDAIAHAWANGSVLVAAAGNNTFPDCQYPAIHPLVVCAAATDHLGLPALYSSLPGKPEGVAVRAPGGRGPQIPSAGLGVGCEEDANVWLTVWPDSIGDCGPALEGYDTGAGTSWATAHVSGVAALLAARGLTNAEVVDCLRRTSSNRGAPDPVMGHGLVDAGAAVVACTVR